MVLNALLPQTVLIVAGCLLILGGRLSRRHALWAPLCLLTLVAAAGSLLGTEVSENRLPGAVVQDSLARLFQWATLGVGLLFMLTVCKHRRASPTSSVQFGLLLLMLGGMLLVGVANDLILLFVALELTALSIYGLLFLPLGEASGAQNAAVRPGKHVALNYFLLGVVSSALLLYGFGFLFGLTGTTNLTEMRGVLTAGDASVDLQAARAVEGRLGIAAMVLIFAGAGFRLAAVPFHFGIPDLFRETSPWHAGLLAVAPKAVALLVLIRVPLGTMAGFEATGQLIALVLAGVTMIVGSVAALAQTNVRRMLAYTAIGQGGFALIGLAVAFWDSAHPDLSLAAGPSLPGGLHATLFYVAVYLPSAGGLFALLVYLRQPDRQIEYVEDLAGLMRWQPAAAVCAVIFLLSLAGFPPLPGFWGRLWMLAAALSVHAESPGALPPGMHPAFLVLAAAAVFHIVLTAAFSLRLVTVVVLAGPISRPRPSGGSPALAAAVLAALVTLGIGLLPGPVLGRLDVVLFP